MEVCGEHGNRADDEIAYVGSSCPACNQIAELTDDYERKIEDLESSNESLTDEVDDLQAQLDAISQG